MKECKSGEADVEGLIMSECMAIDNEPINVDNYRWRVINDGMLVNIDDKWMLMDGGMDGWVGGWMHEWMDDGHMNMNE